MVTTSGYTRDAKDEARKTKTELIDGKSLEALIAKHMKNPK
jgi:restriction endonuclease Mrr